MHHRENERAVLKRKLEAGLSINMPGPRRIGKTWTIDRLVEDMRQADWTVIKIDVEGMSEPKKFAEELCKRINELLPARDKFVTNVSQRFSEMLGGNWKSGNLLDALGPIDPLTFMDTLISNLDKSGPEVAIFIDEIAYFYQKLAEGNKDEAYQFAYQMRGLQQRYKRVRWLLTGSIGLNIIAERHGLSGAFVDFETLPLTPFTPEEAKSYLSDPEVQKSLVTSFTASDDALNVLFSELVWLVPHYLKLVANQVRPTGAKNSDGIATATSADFEAAFKCLLGAGWKHEFKVWPEHVKKNMTQTDQPVAMHILNKLSSNADGETRDTLLAQAAEIEGAITPRRVKDIIAMLENVGLLETHEERIRFLSGLVRRYWNEHHA